MKKAKLLLCMIGIAILLTGCQVEHKELYYATYEKPDDVLEMFNQHRELFDYVATLLIERMDFAEARGHTMRERRITELYKVEHEGFFTDEQWAKVEKLFALSRPYEMISHVPARNGGSICYGLTFLYDVKRADEYGESCKLLYTRVFGDEFFKNGALERMIAQRLEMYNVTQLDENWYVGVSFSEKEREQYNAQKDWK